MEAMLAFGQPPKLLAIRYPIEAHRTITIIWALGGRLLTESKHRQPITLEPERVCSKADGQEDDGDDHYHIHVHKLPACTCTAHEIRSLAYEFQ